jgi:hypothetical protein
MARGIAIAAVLLVCCDSFPGSTGIGVTTSADGQSVEIVYVLCPSKLIEAVSVVPAPEGNPHFDEVVWKITSTTGSRLTKFRVGETPSGFSMRKPLSGRLARSGEYIASIDLKGGGGATMLFEPANLRAGSVFWNGKYLTPRTFRETTQRCEP